MCTAQIVWWEERVRCTDARGSAEAGRGGGGGGVEDHHHVMGWGVQVPPSKPVTPRAV